MSIYSFHPEAPLQIRWEHCSALRVYIGGNDREGSRFLLPVNPPEYVLTEGGYCSFRKNDMILSSLRDAVPICIEPSGNNCAATLSQPGQGTPEQIFRNVRKICISPGSCRILRAGEDPANGSTAESSDLSPDPKSSSLTEQGRLLRMAASANVQELLRLQSWLIQDGQTELSGLVQELKELSMQEQSVRAQIDQTQTEICSARESLAVLRTTLAKLKQEKEALQSREARAKQGCAIIRDKLNRLKSV